MGVKDSFIYEECMKELDEMYGGKQRELSVLKKMAPVGRKEKKLLKKMIHEKRKTK